MPIFTHICRVAAILGLVLGILFIVMGIKSGVNILDPAIAVREQDSQVKLGMTTLFYAMVLGTLAEISLVLHKKNGD